MVITITIMAITTTVKTKEVPQSPNGKKNFVHPKWHRLDTPSVYKSGQRMLLISSTWKERIHLSYSGKVLGRSRGSKRKFSEEVFVSAFQISIAISNRIRLLCLFLGRAKVNAVAKFVKEKINYSSLVARLGS